MKLVSLAIITAGLCIASAIADAAPPISATTDLDRAFWGLSSGLALITCAIVARKRN